MIMPHMLVMHKIGRIRYLVAVRTFACIVSLYQLRDTTEHGWRPSDKAAERCACEAAKRPIITLRNTI